MSLVCALSGSVPEHPVLTKTGYIFEKRLIEKHIDLEGNCPITGTHLAKSDLQNINVSKLVKPKTATASSIPGLLSLFQNEWDALMSETFQLRKQLETARQQLSYSLYQHDASTRVIARLLKERDTDRMRISELEKHVLSSPKIPDTLEDLGISEELLSKMQTLSEELLTARKKRRIEGLTPSDKLKSLHCTGNYPLHSSTIPGVLCIDIDKKSNNRIATGGMDGSICYFDLKTQNTISKLQGHLKKITDVKVHPKDNIILSSSSDKTIRVWKGDDDTYEFKTAYTLKKNQAEVSSLSIHPMNEYFASSAMDKSWSFFDLSSGRSILNKTNLTCNFKCVKFHPDGMILAGAGEDCDFHFWDMRSAKLKVKIAGHSDAISDLSFSENGYYFATASDDGTVRLWDLRKTICFQTIQTNDKSPAKAISFDHSGQYVALASNDIVVNYFETRAQTTPVVTLTDHTLPVTGVCFGPNASFLVSSSMDRTVRLWEP